MAMSRALLLLPLWMVSACGDLSTAPWPDRTAKDGADTSGDLGGDGTLAGKKDVTGAPPTANWLLPLPNTVVALAQDVTFVAQVDSKAVAATELFVSVTLTTGPALGVPPLKPDATGKLVFHLSTLPPGPVTVVLLAMDGGHDAVKAELPLYVDSPPGAPQVAIAPLKPTGADDLLATVTSPGNDVDLGQTATQTYGWQWLKEGLPTDITAATVPAARTDANETWTVRVRAWDGHSWGPPGQASVQIANTKPTLPHVEIAPQKATVADTVACNLAKAATDLDGQELLYKYAWTKNGKPFAEAGNLQALVLATQKKAGGLQQAFPVQAGDVLACSVLVNDGLIIVGPAEATPVTLLVYDGCKADAPPCALAANCTPTQTAEVTCTCKSGFQGDGTKCQDVDECDTGQDACDPAADCTNTVGGYTCGCPSGWSGDGWKCSDVDECALKTFVCDLHADCSNTAGSYQCKCQPGWAGDGKACIDQDECLLGAQVCDPHASCVNLPGSATCTCDLGWAATETNGTASCVDLNECATATACVEGALCTNFQGGYDCTCGPGWQGDGKTCANIDECKQGTFVCAVEATCQDMMGDYLCMCGKGWIGDGKTCDDVDECANGSNQCDPKALCTNKPGGYDCACKEGFAGDGKTCKAEVK